MTDGLFDSGSFRDRHARVFYSNGGIYRGLSPQAHAAWRQLAATRLFAHYTESGGLVRTEEVPPDSVPGAADWAGVLRHDPIPFVSYPYEWSFQMLRAACLLQLDLLLAGLDEGLILKDCTRTTCSGRVRSRCSSMSRRSKRCGRASRGPAIVSSVRCSSTR